MFVINNRARWPAFSCGASEMHITSSVRLWQIWRVYCEESSSRTHSARLETPRTTWLWLDSVFGRARTDATASAHQHRDTEDSHSFLLDESNIISLNGWLEGVFCLFVRSYVHVVTHSVCVCSLTKTGPKTVARCHMYSVRMGERIQGKKRRGVGEIWMTQPTDQHLCEISLKSAKHQTKYGLTTALDLWQLKLGLILQF